MISIDNNLRNNQAQQPPYTWQNVAKAYVVRPGEKREYARTLPLCNKCKFHHNGSCAAKCTNCKRVGHLARDCRSPTAVNTQRALRASQNHGNAARNDEAPRKAYALGGGEPNPDSNVVIGLPIYYRRFIEGFSKVSKPMTKLTQKSVKYEWEDKEEEAF
nr:reverse transcriptase domain-containing protein [Tanacetum cinerariifolium]